MGSIPLGTTSGNWKSGGSSVANLSAPVSQGGQLKVVQPTATVQATAPRSSFQQTTNPQSQVPTTSYAAGYSTDTGGGTGGGLTAAQIAAQQAAQLAAQQEAERAAVRGTISGLIDQALGVYDTLYGNARTAAQSQRGLLEQRYNKETGSLTDQFNAELPKIGRSFAGRGAYDSSYRIEGEAEAGKQFQNQLTDLETQKQADQAKIGQALMEQEAQFGTGKSLLDLTRSQLPQVSDLNELMSVQNEINRKIAELRGSAAGLQSQEAYTQKFGEIAPTGDRMAQLSATLSNIVNGQAPTALKRAVAQQVIGSAGLPEEEKQQLNAQIIQQIG